MPVTFWWGGAKAGALPEKPQLRCENNVTSLQHLNVNTWTWVQFVTVG